MSTSTGSSSAVVQSTNPLGALAAGQIGAQASEAAEGYASQDITNAISSLNNQYAAATAGLQPSSQAGVQALDQLNQYLGLSPESPIAPTAPTNPTMASIEGEITPQQINQYILSNSSNVGNGGLGTGATGLGGVSVDEYMPTGMLSNALPMSGGQIEYGATPSYMNDPTVQANALSALATPAYNQAQQVYQSELPAYNQQLANYNQDQGWMQQYATPLTSAQVATNITNQPGYQAQLSQGLNAVQSQDNAQGYLGSGAILKDLMSYGQNTLSTYYGNTLDLLAKEAGAGQQSATTQAGLSSNLSNNTSQLYGSLADTQANAALSGGNSLMNALISASQEYNTMNTGSSSSTNLSGALSGIGSLASLAF